MPQPAAPEPKPPWFRRRAAVAWLAAVVTFVSIIGVWFQQRSESEAQAEAQAQPTSPAGLVLGSQAEGTSLTAVGRTAGLAEPCTAWLVDTGAGADGAAVAATAGRCVGITDASTVLSGQQLTGATVDFNAFAPVTTAALPQLVRADVEEVLWASTRGTDLALLRLGSTYGELGGRGVAPIAVQPSPPPGTAVLWAGVPVAGIPAEQRYVRATRCALGESRDLVEGPWLFDDVRTTDCSGILGGSAGSPVFNPAGDAVGMLTTTTIGQDAGRCDVGDPCEVGPGTVTSVANTSYVVGVDGLATCWSGGMLRLGGSCPLEDPDSVAAVTTSAAVAAPGSTVSLRLDPQRPAPRRVADRHGILGEIACDDPTGWSDAVPAEEWELDLAMPASGWLVACVGSEQQATAVVVRSEGAAAP